MHQGLVTLKSHHLKIPWIAHVRHHHEPKIHLPNIAKSFLEKTWKFVIQRSSKLSLSINLWTPRRLTDSLKMNVTVTPPCPFWFRPSTLVYKCHATTQLQAYVIDGRGREVTSGIYILLYLSSINHALLTSLNFNRNSRTYYTNFFHTW